MKHLNIRPETRSDHERIRQITRLAFSGRPYAAGDEHELIGTLRNLGALSLSLVAELSGDVIGQITFSPAFPSDGTSDWYTLGPVSVVPDHQQKGVGGELIRTGLAAIEGLGAAGCVLTGNPNYYARFGFSFSPAQLPPGVSEAHFMLIQFDEVLPRGPIHFHPAFGAAA